MNENEHEREWLIVADKMATCLEKMNVLAVNELELKIDILEIIKEGEIIREAKFIFFDARKRGEKYYWLWGLFGLINVPSSLVIYLLVTRVIKKAKS